ncbi:MAG: hypothetical protein KDE59_11380 [Anaerolineales bacterium]|nr:hypothetical protein [Anaerolineales bacterium]
MNWHKRITLIFLLLSATSCAMAPTEPPPTDITLAEPIQPSPTATASLSPTDTIAANPTGTPPPAGSASRTPRPTNTWVPTQAVTPRNTPIPLAPRPSPTWTPLALPELVWNESWGEVRELPAGKAAWSPVANDLFLIGCNESASELEFLMAGAPSFTPRIITPDRFYCTDRGLINLAWQPNGSTVIFNHLTADHPWQNFWPDSAMYSLTSDGQELRELSVYGKSLSIHGWMNEDWLVVADQYSGGLHLITVLDVTRDEIPVWARLYAHRVNHVEAEYLASSDGPPEMQLSAVVIYTHTLNPDSDPAIVNEGTGPFLRALSFDYASQPVAVEFNSRYEDWLSGSADMLVLTWPAYTDFPVDALHESAISSLQLWNVESNSLTVLVPGAIYGRVSPSRQFVVYLVPGAEAPRLLLLNRLSGILTQLGPSQATFEQYAVSVHAETTFSPDSQYLTYFDANGNLVLYNLAEQTSSATLSAVFAAPLWSPDSRFLVYEDPAAGLSVLEVATGRSLPLATSGAARLSTPQWSHDGAYLAVTIAMPDHTHHTAVITLPQPP